ncbi:MAG: (2Fe-2S)-binding protein [Prevotellaceae bacterium]|nr:(2Fe-2S)-binding protein [Prevotellaceae bacterium]
MYNSKIYYCMGVNLDETEKAIKSQSLKTVEYVGEATGARTGCGGCHVDIQEILDRVNS